LSRPLCGTCNADAVRKNIFQFAVTTMGQRLRNARHERFAREVAALTPLASAYGQAGFGGDSRWHPFNASKLANKPKVKARIDELRVEFEKLSAISADYVRHQLLKMVEANLCDFYERDPDDPRGKRLRLRCITELPRSLTAAIVKVKLDPETGMPVEITLGSKHEAAATLLRSLPGGATERHEVSLDQLVQSSMRIEVVTNVPQPLDEANRIRLSLPAASQTEARRF
jgi:hypothetical protein